MKDDEEKRQNAKFSLRSVASANPHYVLVRRGVVV
jgi:hypothetical protein